MEGNSEHHADGHQCPPYVLGEEECEMLANAVPYEELRYHDSEDAIFWVPHQMEPRVVEFNVLTSTIDDIISKCGYPESERERLQELHRRSAQAFLNDYVGPIKGPVPLLGETLPTTAG